MMKVFAKRSPWEPVRSYREEYRREMACQIVHDSLHRRPGWTEWYTLSLGDKAVGYGAVAVGGPWKGKRTAFEFYVSPPHRSALVDLFDAFITGAHAVEVSAQTNDAQLCIGLHQRCRDIQAEALVFHDGLATSLKVPGARVRKRAENEPVFEHKVEPVGDYAVEFEDEVVATGGYLTHYNPPFVDIFMEVRPNMRRLGFGALLVQGIKRAAHEQKLVPCARCNLENLGSRRTLARAGMIPCAHLVRGKIEGV